MSEHINQGWYRNLWVGLSGPETRLRLEVRLVVRYAFHSPSGGRETSAPTSAARPWTDAERAAWRRDFAALIRTRWSRQHRLYGDVSRDPIDLRRLTLTLPIAEVDVRVVDKDEPGDFRVPDEQRFHHVHVWRGVSGLAHGSAVDRVIVLQDRDIRQHGDQTVAVHEVGHLLGLVHVNCWSHQQSRRADVNVMNDGRCYIGPDWDTVMGGGDRIRARDYVVFAYIMSRLRPDWLWSAGSAPAEGPGGRRLAAATGTMGRSTRQARSIA